MKSNKEASIAEIKRFFDISTMQEMKKEWEKLSSEEKAFFKIEVGKVIHS